MSTGDTSRAKFGRTVRRGCLLPFAIAIACYLIWSGSLAVKHVRQERAASACADNMRALSRAMEMYLADSAGAFPPANDWSDKLAPYVSDASRFVCPNARAERCGYAFSAKLGGLRADSIQDAEETIMLFESDRGWNAAGGAELLPDMPRHNEGDYYAFADGRVFWKMRKSGEGWHWYKDLQDEEVRRWDPVVR